MNYQPQYLSELPFQLSTNHIMDLFLKEAKKSDFQVLDKEFNMIVVMKENVSQLESTLKNLVCLRGQTAQDDGTLCLIRLQIDTNQVKCIRLVQVKGVIGNARINEILVDRFGRSVDRLKQKSQGIKVEEVQIYNDASEFTNITKDNLAQYYNILEQQQALEISSNPYYLETTAFYMFHKIFCASNYGLGRQISDHISKTEKQLEQGQLSLEKMKHIVEGVGNFITSVVDTLFMSFNFGKQETRQIMPFCRLSAEKYLYLRLFDKIYPKYKSFYEKQDLVFREQRKVVLSQFDTSQLKEKYQIQESQDDKQKFESSVQEINKLKVMYTPREKLRCFQIMNSILKAMNNAYTEEYRKLCFLISDIEDPYTQVYFLIDSGANLDKKFLDHIKHNLNQVQEDFRIT